MPEPAVPGSPAVDGDEASPLRRLPAGLSAAEVHSHTLASDGMVTADQLVLAASAVGLGALCITDHDTLGVTPQAVELGRVVGVDVVSGQEITTAMPPGIHLAGLFLDRPVRMHMSLEDTIDAIHDQGGLALLCHPFMPTWFASITPGRARRLLEHRRLDGIELRHTAPMLPGGWGRLDNFYAEHRLQLGAAVGAGDSHFGAGDLGRLVTLFPGAGAAALRLAIESGTTSPFRGIRPRGPSLRTRLAQQQRSMIWLAGERRAGRVGHGAGPGQGRPCKPAGWHRDRGPV
ncbi:MAG: PHP domain-containing protein [Candidatus Dormibacteria bacterium]